MFPSEETGNVHPIPVPISQRSVRPRAINVLANVESHTYLNVRKIANDLGICKTTDHNISVDYKLFHYHMVWHPALVETNFDRILDYCY